MAEIAQTADHALRILEELGKGVPLTPSELSDRLGLNRTVLHRLLMTLSARGFVLRHGTSYKPGAALLRLASSLEPSLRAAADPVMTRLSEMLRESVVLSILDGSDVTVLHQVVATNYVLQVSHRIGARHPLVQGASGRAILAYLPEVMIRQVVRGHAHAATLMRRLETVRTIGYALSNDELQNDVHGVAVPLFDATGDVRASLAVLVPTGRAGALDGYVDGLWEGSQEISRAVLPAAGEINFALPS